MKSLPKSVKTWLLALFDACLLPREIYWLKKGLRVQPKLYSSAEDQPENHIFPLKAAWSSHWKWFCQDQPGSNVILSPWEAQEMCTEALPAVCSVRCRFTSRAGASCPVWPFVWSNFLLFFEQFDMVRAWQLVWSQHHGLLRKWRVSILILPKFLLCQLQSLFTSPHLSTGDKSAFAYLNILRPDWLRKAFSNSWKKCCIIVLGETVLFSCYVSNTYVSAKHFLTTYVGC